MGERVIEVLDQTWVADWQIMPPQLTKEGVEWIRQLPLCLRPLLLRFPPSCLVRAVRPLACPAPDTIGLVASYAEPDHNFPMGAVAVRQDPKAAARFECDPHALEVVGYWHGLTPAVVAQILSTMG